MQVKKIHKKQICHKTAKQHKFESKNCLYEKWIIRKSPKTEILENLAVGNQINYSIYCVDNIPLNIMYCYK